MVHRYSRHTDIHLCIFNKWIIRHEYRTDTSTRELSYGLCFERFGIWKFSHIECRRLRTQAFMRKKINKMTIHALPYLKCISLVSVRSSLPWNNIGVRIELTKRKTCDKKVYFLSQHRNYSYGRRVSFIRIGYHTNARKRDTDIYVITRGIARLIDRTRPKSFPHAPLAPLFFAKISLFNQAWTKHGQYRRLNTQTPWLDIRDDIGLISFTQIGVKGWLFNSAFPPGSTL